MATDLSRLCWFLFFAISFDLFGLNLTVEDIVSRKETHTPEVLKELQWVKDTHQFSYVDNQQSLIVANRHGNKLAALTLFDLNQILKADYKGFPGHTWIDASRFWFRHGNQIMTYNIESKELTEANILKEGAGNIAVFSPEMVAYTVLENVFLSLSKEIAQISFSSSAHILNGGIVHREEFGITKGIFWSPQGDKFAYYRMDQTMVEDYPFEDFQKLPVKIDLIKYPMAGQKSHEVTLIVYDLRTKLSVTLNTGLPADQYLTGVTFSGDGSFILVNILNREQNHLICNKYDATTGQHMKQVFSISADKYIDPHFGFYFQKQDPHRAIWCSRHEGCSRLYACDTNTHTITPMKKIHGDIEDCKGFSGDNESFFYAAYDENYPCRHGYVYNHKRDELRALTYGEKGVHSIIPSSDGTLVLDVFSNSTTPYQVDLLDNQGRKITTIHASPNPLKDFRLGNIRLVSLKSADGSYDLHGRMIYPPGFCPHRIYPVIVYVYGGPGIQIVQDSWLYGARLWELMMSQKGYIVFALDNRGSANRGLQFEQETYGELGTQEIADQMEGVKYLKSLPFVDKTSIGVFGWSFGGFMATSLMLKHPDVFKVGVAGGAVIDWANYEVMYTERYMKKPAENPQGYEKANLLNYVQDLKGKLFVVSGTHDDVVVPRHTKLLVAKAIEYEKDIDAFFYPYGAHHFGKKSNLHMYKKITKLFDDNLRD